MKFRKIESIKFTTAGAPAATRWLKREERLGLLEIGLLAGVRKLWNVFLTAFRGCGRF
jgi:hypothetical protein